MLKAAKLRMRAGDSQGPADAHSLLCSFICPALSKQVTINCTAFEYWKCKEKVSGRTIRELEQRGRVRADYIVSFPSKARWFSKQEMVI